MIAYSAVDAINQQWSDLKRRSRTVNCVLAFILGLGLICFFWQARWQTSLGLGISCVVSLGGLVALETNPFSYWGLLRAGLLPTPQIPLSIAVEGEHLVFSRNGVSAAIPLSDVGSATLLFHDSWTQLRGLDDVLVVRIASQELSVPESSTGFRAFFDWISSNRELQRRGFGGEDGA